MQPALRKGLWIGALCLASALLGLGVYTLMSPTREPPLGPAPDIAMPDLDGGPRRLAEWRGKLLLVNFWATWCTPCLHEIPMLVALQERYAARGLQIIGPAMDDPEAVRNAIPQLGIRYPVMVGDAEVAAAMDALGDRLGALPFSVLISAQGELIARKHGEFEWQELDELIRRHLPPG